MSQSNEAHFMYATGRKHTDDRPTLANIMSYISLVFHSSSIRSSFYLNFLLPHFSNFISCSSELQNPSRQSPIQRVPGAPTPEVKRPGRETDHSRPSSIDVKNTWSCTSTSPIRLHGVVLI